MANITYIMYYLCKLNFFIHVTFEFPSFSVGITTPRELDISVS